MGLPAGSDRTVRPFDPDRLAERRRRALEGLGAQVPASDPKAAAPAAPAPAAAPAPSGGTPPVGRADYDAVLGGAINNEEYFARVRERGVSAADPRLGRQYEDIARASGDKRDKATAVYLDSLRGPQAAPVASPYEALLDAQPEQQLQAFNAMRPGATPAKTDATRVAGTEPGARLPETRIPITRGRGAADGMTDEQVADHFLGSGTPLPEYPSDLAVARNRAYAEMEEGFRAAEEQDTSPEALRRRLARYQE